MSSRKQKLSEFVARATAYMENKTAPQISIFSMQYDGKEWKPLCPCCKNEISSSGNQICPKCGTLIFKAKGKKIGAKANKDGSCGHYNMTTYLTSKDDGMQKRQCPFQLLLEEKDSDLYFAVMTAKYDWKSGYAIRTISTIFAGIVGKNGNTFFRKKITALKLDRHLSAIKNGFCVKATAFNEIYSGFFMDSAMQILRSSGYYGKMIDFFSGIYDCKNSKETAPYCDYWYPASIDEKTDGFQLLAKYAPIVKESEEKREPVEPRKNYHTQEMNDARIQYRKIPEKLIKEMSDIRFSWLNPSKVYGFGTANLNSEGVHLSYECPCCKGIMRESVFFNESEDIRTRKEENVHNFIEKCPLCGFQEKGQMFNGNAIGDLAKSFGFLSNRTDFFTKYSFNDAVNHSGPVFYVLVEPSSLPDDAVLIRYFVKISRLSKKLKVREITRFFLTKDKISAYTTNDDGDWDRKQFARMEHTMPPMNLRNTICLTPAKTIKYLMQKISRDSLELSKAWGLDGNDEETFRGDVRIFLPRQRKRL